MNLFFWKRRKKYDEELERHLEQSQLYPHLQAALQVIDHCISGDLHFEFRTHRKLKVDDSIVDIWYITDKIIELKVYSKERKRVLFIDCAYYSKKHTTYNFVLKLPMSNGDEEFVHIEKTKLYEEIKEKMFYLHNPRRLKESNENRSKRILKENAQKHRLQNLFK